MTRRNLFAALLAPPLAFLGKKRAMSAQGLRNLLGRLLDELQASLRKPNITREAFRQVAASERRVECHSIGFRISAGERRLRIAQLQREVRDHTQRLKLWEGTRIPQNGRSD